jgi:LEA14-like dessication related protein
MIIKKTALLFLLVPLLFSCGGGDLKDPEFVKVENVVIQNASMQQSTVRVDLQFFNPNKKSAQLKKADGVIWMAEDKMGSFLLDSSISIPANAFFSVPVYLQLDLKTLAKQALMAFMSDSVSFKIDGHARVGRKGFFKTYPFHYQGKQDLAPWLNGLKK